MSLSYEDAMRIMDSFNDPYIQTLRRNQTASPSWGIETTRTLLSQLGDPHLAYPVIHVAGTKGKGSTCAYITQGLMAAGLKTGLFISPHLEDFSERIQINREPIGPEAFARAVDGAHLYAKGIEGLNHFEFLTAVAFLHFALEDVDVAVIEVGLGGRLDSTNVVQPLVTAITNISIDHQRILGSSIEEIARDKAGIIKPGVPVVVAPQHTTATEVLQTIAEEQGSPLIQLGKGIEVQTLSSSWHGNQFAIRNGTGHNTYQTRMLGQFQVENAAVAVMALREAGKRGLPVDEPDIQRGIEQAYWAGRMEVMSEAPLVLIDGAHNTHSIMRLMESVSSLHNQRDNAGRLIVVFGCMQDKDRTGMLGHILSAADTICLTPLDGHHRSTSLDDLLTAIQSARNDMNGSTAATVVTFDGLDMALDAALQMASPQDTICVTGSLVMAGRTRSRLIQYVSQHE